MLKERGDMVAVSENNTYLKRKTTSEYSWIHHPIVGVGY
jgi:hypothetical protein